jgi:hypothetical protein
MAVAKRLYLLLLSVAVLLGVVAWGGIKAIAQSPNRATTLIVAYTEYEYWLLRWSDNEILCGILIDHEGLPTAEEVAKACGAEIAEEWSNTPPCSTSEKGEAATRCNGFYLHLVSFEDKEREVVVELPPPAAWISLEGCQPAPPENRCSEIPNLLLTGEEPLPNETILSIEGILDGNPFLCEASACSLKLESTPPEGILLEFWANSSFGDATERYTAQVRVLDTGVSEAPGGSGWYVDVISSQWSGPPIASCALIWEAFPPAGPPPDWLATPEQNKLLASDAPYYYLAGRLIAQGLVAAAECPSGGLLPNGYADACGLEKASSFVTEWQNQFDARILAVAQETGVPAQLMKNLFAQESQFWPGIFRVPHEYGLGQITDNGADSILLWNRSFFKQFCPLVLAEDSCAGGYLKLSADNQALLRGALAVQAKADCSDCPTGIDLTNVDFSVSLFAETLKANCQQVGQLVFTATQQHAGVVSNYEDLWRFTIANYHAGPGCVSYALHTAWERSGVLTWEEVSQQFTETCQGVVPYVEKIAPLDIPGEFNPSALPDIQPETP